MNSLERALFAFLMTILAAGLGARYYFYTQSRADFQVERSTLKELPQPSKSKLSRHKAPLLVQSISLNKSSAKRFETLPGIGPVLASRILEYRREHGLFQAKEEILRVRGIGPALYKKIAPYLLID